MRKIAKVLVKKVRRSGWPEWVVTSVTEAGGYTDRQTYQTGGEARIAAHQRAAQFKAQVEEVQS